MKKPETKVAEPFPDPPGHLSENSKELWRVIGPAEAANIARRTLFLSALESLDRADSARQIIATEGLIVKTEKSGVSHVHPATKVEREARAAFAKIWSVLGLSWKGGKPFEAI